MQRSRGWIIVINNFNDDDIADMMSLYEVSKADYVLTSFEVGESGTPHIQGYVYFSNKKTFKRFILFTKSLQHI